MNITFGKIIIKFPFICGSDTRHDTARHTCAHHTAKNEIMEWKKKTSYSCANGRREQKNKNQNENERKNCVFTQLLLTNSQMVDSRHQNIWIFMLNSEHVYSFPLLLKIVSFFILLLLFVHSFVRSLAVKYSMEICMWHIGREGKNYNKVVDCGAQKPATRRCWFHSFGNDTSCDEWENEANVRCLHLLCPKATAISRSACALSLFRHYARRGQQRYTSKTL